MNELTVESGFARRVLAALIVVAASSVSGVGGAASAFAQARAGDVTLAQSTVQEKAPSAVDPARAGSATNVVSWTFGSSQPAGGAGWTAERGTMTPGQGEALLQPDRNRHVALLSPPGLPDAVRHAGEFFVGVSGTGLQRVRIQGRRDPRGGWITIADASGAAMRKVADGYAIKRNVGVGAPGAPIERLRIDLTFRTTNPRPLTRISVNPAPG